MSVGSEKWCVGVESHFGLSSLCVSLRVIVESDTEFLVNFFFNLNF